MLSYIQMFTKNQNETFVKKRKEKKYEQTRTGYFNSIK